MKFKINCDHFSHGLSQVLNVVGSKAAMPILSNVLIEAEKDSISLTTTNLDLGIRCKIKAEVKESGSVTLPVKRLATIVRQRIQEHGDTVIVLGGATSNCVRATVKFSSCDFKFASAAMRSGRFCMAIAISSSTVGNKSLSGSVVGKSIVVRHILAGRPMS